MPKFRLTEAGQVLREWADENHVTLKYITLHFETQSSAHTFVQKATKEVAHESVCTRLLEKRVRELECELKKRSALRVSR